MKKFMQMCVSQANGMTNEADGIVKTLEKGWTIENVIPVGDKTIVVFSQEEKFDPNKRVDYSRPIDFSR